MMFSEMRRKIGACILKYHFQALKISLTERHQRSGDLAYLLEPDLKEAKGGLRDAAALRAIATAGVISVPLDRISAAEAILSNAREELHRMTNRPKDKLLFQEQDKVAAQLMYKDADNLMADIAQSARSIAYLLDFTLHRLEKKGIFNRTGKNYYLTSCI